MKGEVSGGRERCGVVTTERWTDSWTRCMFLGSATWDIVAADILALDEAGTADVGDSSTLSVSIPGNSRPSKAILD